MQVWVVFALTVLRLFVASSVCTLFLFSLFYAELSLYWLLFFFWNWCRFGWSFVDSRLVLESDAGYGDFGQGFGFWEWLIIFSFLPSFFFCPGMLLNFVYLCFFSNLTSPLNCYAAELSFLACSFCLSFLLSIGFCLSWTVLCWTVYV